MSKKLPPITVVAIFLALYTLFLPIAQSLGFVQTLWSGRAGSPMALVDAAVCLGLCFFLSTAILVMPMAFAGYLDRGTSHLRTMQVALLWSLPSIAFGYFIGEFRGPLQTYDFAVGIVLPVVAGAVFYRRTQRWLETSVLMALAFFYSLFMIGDILGPFPTFVRFASSTTAAYALKTSLSFAALACVFMLPVRVDSEDGEEADIGVPPASVMAGLAGLGLMLVTLRQTLSDDTYLLASDLAPITMLMCAWVFFRGEHFSVKVRKIVCAGQVAALLVPVSRAFTSVGADLWTQSILGFQILGVAVFGYIWMRLQLPLVQTRSVGR